MKTIRFKEKKLTIIGFKLFWFNYGRLNDNYRIEAIIFKDFSIPIYISKTKPIIRNLFFLNIFFFSPIFFSKLILHVVYFIYKYIDGAKNFISNSSWYQNVRLFNNVNIILIFILIIFLILK